MAFLIARLIGPEVTRLVTISVRAEMAFFRSNGLAEITRPGWIIEALFPEPVESVILGKSNMLLAVITTCWVSGLLVRLQSHHGIQVG